MVKANSIYELLGIDKELFLALSISGVSASIIILFNMYYIQPLDQKMIYALINIFAVMILILPATFIRYANYQKIKTIEERFPDFLRDIVEGLRGGMSLPLAIKYTSKNNYGILTHEIKNLIAQISWGIPFEKSISNFAIKLKSKTISRAIQTIIEAHRSGGNLADVIEAVGQSTVELEKIKRERTSRISSQMMQGYIIYFVFLGVMVGIQKVLIPSLSMSSGAATGSMLGGAITGSDTDITNALMGGSNTAVIDVAAYGVMFSHLAVIQGFFSGIAIGKLAEGSLDAGLKHAVLLAILGYTVMVLFGTI